MSDVAIRPATPRERGAVRDVVTNAFGDHGPVVADLVDALHDVGHALVSLVAELDGEVVGHVQLNRSWIDARQRLVEVLVFWAHDCVGLRDPRLSALEATFGRVAPPGSDAPSR